MQLKNMLMTRIYKETISLLICVKPSAKKVAYLVEKNYPADKLVDVMKQAKDARENGQQVLVVRMNKNKKFQKDQLTKDGYEEFVEFFNK